MEANPYTFFGTNVAIVALGSFILENYFKDLTYIHEIINPYRQIILIYLYNVVIFCYTVPHSI